MNESWQDTIVRISKPVRYSAAAALGMLAIFLLIISINALGNLGRTENPYMNTITVEGTGKAASIPNLAVISFSVTETGATVGEAQGKATEKTDAALSAMKEQGIEEKDIKTTAYNVYPQYENIPPCYSGICEARNPRIIGYQVSQTVEVKVRDTSKAGDVLQALGSLNVQNISGPNFTVDEDDAVRNDARAEAIEEARAKAKELAKQLGVRLGKVVSFYENQGPMPYDGYYGKGGVAMDMAAEQANAPSLPTGENETEVTVSITYEIR
jgi:uncharacterized protein